MAFPDKPSKIQIDPLFVPLTYLQILFNDKTMFTKSNSLRSQNPSSLLVHIKFNTLKIYVFISTFLISTQPHLNVITS